MEQLKIPDIKLKIGSLIAIVTTSINILWTLIYTILVFSVQSIYDREFHNIKSTDTITVVTIAKVVVIVSALFSIIMSALIIWFSFKVLKGAAKNGLVPGLILIVFSTITIIYNAINWAPILIPNLLIGVVSLTAGILLVIGKYLNDGNQPVGASTVLP